MMALPNKTPMLAFLQKMESYPGNHWLFVPPGELTFQCEVMIFDVNSLPPDVENPPEVDAAGYLEGLEVSDVWSIKRNAQNQGRKPTDEELLRALIYYLDRDAYLNFDNEKL